MDTMTDCVIIGGGLAGLTLAIQLADAGHSVMLFEKEKYPFHRVCGEYVSMESYDFLHRLGVSLCNMDMPVINEVLVSSPNGDSLVQKLGLGGFGISRYTLDNILAKLAIEKGVMLHQGTKVDHVYYNEDHFLIKAGKNVYNSKLVCGAYGKKAGLDRVLKRKFREKQLFSDKKKYIAVKYYVDAGPPEHRIELHNFNDGYCGISKVDGDKYCLCYLTDSKNLTVNYNNIRLMESRVLMQNPFLEKYFSKSKFLNEQPYTISHITFDKKSAIEQHMLMLGDAAGTIAPMCGNGMSMAMHASYIAAGLAHRFLKGTISREGLEQAYEEQWNNNFSGRITAGRQIQKLFGKTGLTNFSVGLLKYTPFVSDQLIRLTHGQPY